MRFIQKKPDLKITLLEYSKENIISMVQNGQVETGFIYRTTFDDMFFDQLPDDIVFQQLLRGRIVLLTGENSELVQSDSITMKKVSKYPLISYSPTMRNKNEEMLFRKLYNLRVELSIETSFSMFKEKILRNIANSLSVFFETEKYPTNFFEGAKVLEIRNDIKIHFGFIKGKDSTLSLQIAFFLNELTKQIENYTKNIG